MRYLLSNVILLTSRSSSSAIFERDIEPIVSPSPPSAHHHQFNPHRIPRSKGTEQLEQSVPSVLDSAATILAGVGKDEVAVVSPAASLHDLVERSSGFASPIGSLRSRSPSPSRVGTSSPRGDLLLTIPVSPQATSFIASPASILGLQNMGSPPFATHLVPTHSQPSAKSAFVPTTPAAPLPSLTDTNVPDTPTTYTNQIYPIIDSTSSSPQSSPKTTTVEQHPSGQLHPLFVPANVMSPMTSPSSLSSHPPSPVHLPKKRLSFISYNDLLSSTPTTTQPLSSLTTGASAADPPPHIPSVSGLNIASAVYSSACTSPASRAPSLRGYSLGAVGIGPTGGLTHPGKRDSITMLDNLGGEWEREGMGKGLEERLDTVSPTAMPIGGKA
jgi:hypothetical protein